IADSEAHFLNSSSYLRRRRVACSEFCIGSDGLFFMVVSLILESVRFRGGRQQHSALVAGSRDTKHGRFPPTLHLAPEFEPAPVDELPADSTASAASWPSACLLPDSQPTRQNPC